MSIALLFWVIMILTLLYGFWSSWPPNKSLGNFVLNWVLFALLGWAVFGPALHR